MAGPAANQALLLERNWNDGAVVYKIHFESEDVHGEAAPETRPFVSVHPVARWSEEQVFSAFAVSGSSILAIVGGSRHTVVRDTVTQADAPGPRLRDRKRQPVMLPVGDDTVVVIDKLLRGGRFEALRRLPGGRWRADPLPTPPVRDLGGHPDEDGYVACVSAYFAMGTRAWVTVADQGTFSLDTKSGTWRVEGSWELPIRDRGFFVPELGSVVGLSEVAAPGPSWEQVRQVCALDVGAGRPPVVRHVWHVPAERVHGVTEEHVDIDTLGYLGNGRFCLSRSVVVELSKVIQVTFKGKGTSFTVVDVKRLPGGELELAKCGKRHIHTWPIGHYGQALFL
ncbi:hypothetical protein ACP70R_019569 [Stipagrostis hirtigluma subsp. patula]